MSLDGTLSSSVSRFELASRQGDIRDASAVVAPEPRFSRDDLLDKAEDFAQRILDHRLRARDGSITWQRPNRSAEKEAIPIGPFLYDGAPGVAIFFAALARVKKLERYREFSFEIIAPLRRLLGRLANDPERASKLKIEIGGLTGIGGYIYAFLILADLLDEPELLAEARRMVPWITDERIAADSVLDIVGGATGAILALLALDRRMAEKSDSDPTPTDVAWRCARHLVDQRIDLSEEACSWTTNPIHPPLNGFVHGSAGICCALLLVFEKTGDAELMQTALRGWAFERATYSEEHKNWRDLTVDTERFLNQWCFGAPGIVMGRLMTTGVIDDDSVRSEIRNGLQSTADLNLTRADHVCCGNMGRVEALLFAAQELGSAGQRDPALEAAALELAGRIVERAEEAGSPQWMVDCDLFDPSFFSGAAGFGYTLLRLARSDARLPSLLAFE